MPKLQVRKPGEVPPRSSSTSRAVLEQQRMYDSFISQLNGNVGELALSPDENVRSVKTRLRRASTRLTRPIEIWDANGKVYFRSEAPRRRGRRPEKA
jgi:hypothetical protein